MLPKKINRTKTYYKITNKEECHYGLQYKEGLNTDPVPFNNDPEASCCRGGIYFTTQEHIHRFMYSGCWIREVIIPKDAKVVLDPSGNKYRTNKIILGERHDFNWYFNNIFDKETFLTGDYQCLIAYCPKYFNKWFDKRSFPEENYWYLTEHCSEYFNIWFDKKTYPKNRYWALAKNCQEYESIWG